MAGVWTNDPAITGEQFESEDTVIGSQSVIDNVTDKSTGAGRGISPQNYGQTDYTGGYGGSNSYIGQHMGGGQPSPLTSGFARFRNESLLRRQKPGKVGKGGGGSGGGGCSCGGHDEQSKTGQQIKNEAQAAQAGNSAASTNSTSSQGGNDTPTQSGGGCCTHEQSVIPPKNKAVEDSTTRKATEDTKNVYNSTYDPCNIPGLFLDKRKLIIHIYQTQASVYNDYLTSDDMKKIRAEIIRIYKMNGIDIDVRIIDSPKAGDEKFNKFVNKQLSSNQGVFQLSWGTRPSGSPCGTHAPVIPGAATFEFDIKQFHDIEKLSQDNKINQIARGTAHEILHYYIQIISYYFDLRKTTIYDERIDLEEALGLYDGHATAPFMHLNSSVQHQYNVMGDNTKMILSEQKVVINTYLKALLSSPCNKFMANPFYRMMLIKDMLRQILQIRKNEHR